MTANRSESSLAWLEPGDDFPPVSTAWGPQSPAPGLLAAGGALDVTTLCQAYREGIFPWYSTGQPILWWSTDPRMVLQTAHFRLAPSLRKQIRSLIKQNRLEIRFDGHFSQVIHHCASTPRHGQSGTWIIPDMVRAYMALHAAGHAHCVETWLDGQLVGGLYAVNIGRMVYGESMFSHVSNASKIALCALVAFCRTQHMPLIDCQQETPHLASLGANPVARTDFLREVQQLTIQPSPHWAFAPTHWDSVLTHRQP